MLPSLTITRSRRLPVDLSWDLLHPEEGPFLRDAPTVSRFHLIQGDLDLLILEILCTARKHGYETARAIKEGFLGGACGNPGSAR